MKSKIALILCITQLFTCIGGYRVDASSKTKHSKKSSLSKKLSVAFTILATGTLIALHAKHRYRLAQDNAINHANQQLWNVLYAGWRAKPDAYVLCQNHSPALCFGMTNDLFVQQINLNTWMEILQMNAVDATAFIGKIYYGPFEVYPIKQNLTLSEAMKITDRLEKTDPQGRFHIFLR